MKHVYGFVFLFHFGKINSSLWIHVKRLFFSHYYLSQVCYHAHTWTNDDLHAVNWTPRDKFHSIFIQNTKSYLFQEMHLKSLKVQAIVKVSKWITDEHTAIILLEQC